ncbi:patatin-like phospholipase family protein [Aquabacterium sp.]|uniref:patatin-like phospholipase family protein n=1 Tax=Aquabacterium sp. TaxID=1872578 RepID=UPI002B7379C7|nr:patatin-like phospholipase family protein [Aquabacterium sp.]HSW07513.1 patatin-like phospholipase family protein [Aquabacterium sp.]
MQALQIHAGARARQRLRERGLQPEDVRVIAGAAGGPKGLVLNPLDQLLFGRWLADTTHTVHLVGASIGAWRMVCATLDDPAAALQRLATDYIEQRYDSVPGRGTLAKQMSEIFGARLREHFEGHEAQALGHARYRLHVFTSLGRGLLKREGRVRTPLGYLGAFTTNLVSRRAMGGWLQRVIFSDQREPLPFHLHDYRTHQVPLTPDNLSPAVLASCSIPFLLAAVHDIPGAPRGAYWDGGITDYHLHLDYASMADGLVLYPHFQRHLVPGWLDKALKHRHRASERLANVVVLAPHPEWVKTLPNGKLPDRSDFKAYGTDAEGRMRAWRSALAHSRQLADEFEQLATQSSIDALPLS